MTSLSSTSLPPDLQQTLVLELKDGERLLWTGQPVARISPVLTAIFVATGLFLIVVGSLAAYMTTKNPVSGSAQEAVPPVLLAIPVCLAGVFACLMPTLVPGQSKRTIFAVTDSRAIIMRCAGSKTVESYYAADIGEVIRTERLDGTSNVMFTRTTSGASPSAPTGFFGLRNAGDVEGLLRNITSAS